NQHPFLLDTSFVSWIGIPILESSPGEDLSKPMGVISDLYSKFMSTKNPVQTSGFSFGQPSGGFGGFGQPSGGFGGFGQPSGGFGQPSGGFGGFGQTGSGALPTAPAVESKPASVYGKALITRIEASSSLKKPSCVKALSFD
ncbi:hypothetical protein ADUPG1_004299, partial [Aduncisulcus paluster]